MFKRSRERESFGLHLLNRNSWPCTDFANNTNILLKEDNGCFFLLSCYNGIESTRATKNVCPSIKIFSNCQPKVLCMHAWAADRRHSEANLGVAWKVSKYLIYSPSQQCGSIVRGFARIVYSLITTHTRMKIFHISKANHKLTHRHSHHEVFVGHFLRLPARFATTLADLDLVVVDFTDEVQFRVSFIRRADALTRVSHVGDTVQSGHADTNLSNIPLTYAAWLFPY
jgi:hypothetical protein